MSTKLNPDHTLLNPSRMKPHDVEKSHWEDWLADEYVQIQRDLADDTLELWFAGRTVYTAGSVRKIRERLVAIYRDEEKEREEHEHNREMREAEENDDEVGRFKADPRYRYGVMDTGITDAYEPDEEHEPDEIGKTHAGLTRVPVPVSFKKARIIPTRQGIVVEPIRDDT